MCLHTPIILDYTIAFMRTERIYKQLTQTLQPNLGAEQFKEDVSQHYGK